MLYFHHIDEHDLHKPCCKFVVVELPSAVTAIDPAVDVPVSVFVLRVAIMPSLRALMPISVKNQHRHLLQNILLYQTHSLTHCLTNHHHNFCRGFE